MTIGEVAKATGFAASAIRYYEQEGLLPKAARIGGRRQYDPSIVERLALVDRARACGFTLPETRRLFSGFREGTPPSERWRLLAERKIAELEELERKIAAMKAMLQRPCRCADLDECGRRYLAGKTATTPRGLRRP